jgi:tetratricopeptide (TPR) repeat protein
MNAILQEIDEALADNDVRRAEVAIARYLRDDKNPPELRAELYFRRAQARLMDARPDDALEALATAIALQPEKANHPATFVLMGDIHFARFELAPVGFTDRSDTETAMGYYRQALQENHPHIGWVHYQTGRLLLSRNQSETALDHFQQVLSYPPIPPHLHALAHERIGFIELFDNRQPRRALEHFQEAEKHYPPNPNSGWLTQLHIRVSRTYRELGEHEAALEAARKALRQIQNGSTSGERDTLPEALLAVAEVMAAMPGYEAEAIEHYLRFLQASKRPPGIDVTWSQVYETVGNLSFRLERYQQAIAAFEKALEYNPYHPWEINLLYQIARCHYRTRAYERSIAAVRRALELAQADGITVTDWHIYNLLGNAHFALENYHEAALAYRQALQLAPAGTEPLEKTRIYLRFAEELSQSSD